MEEILFKYLNTRTDIPPILSLLQDLGKLRDNIKHDLSMSEWLYSHCLLISDKTKIMLYKKGFMNSSYEIVIKCHTFDCRKFKICSNECFQLRM